MPKRLVSWIALLALTVTSCTSAINLRPEDYGGINPDYTYRIVTLDNREYQATKLTIKDDVATFMQDGEPVSVPLAEVKLIQHINKNELLTGVVGLGLVAALAVGLIVLLEPD